MERWKPPVELSKREQFIMKRLKRVRALFSFLRLNRHVLFDETFQEQLEGMYRQTGAGDEPHPPATVAASQQVARMPTNDARRGDECTMPSKVEPA